MTDLDDLIQEHVQTVEGVHRFGVPEAQQFLDGVEKRVLAAWLRMRAPELVALEMQRYAMSLRGQARARGPARAFADYAKAAPAEDVAARFRVSYVIDKASNRKRLCDMTAADLHSAADRFEQRANTIALEGALLRAVAKRLKPGQVVSDVWQPSELDDLFKAA